MTKFSKGEHYRFSLTFTEDNTCPSDGAHIEITSARGKKVKYKTIEGNSPKYNEEFFYKDSEMTQNLTLIK